MLKIKNTLTNELEEFKSTKNNRVTFYQCGPTVYWTQHIGNFRGMTWGDLIVRVFQFNDYDVVHVRNYTDVGHLTSDTDEGEDKMEKGAKRENATPQKFAFSLFAPFSILSSPSSVSEVKCQTSV